MKNEVFMSSCKPWLNKELAPNEKTVQDNFGQWFKESKVVDWDKDPLKLYHGTASPFDAFDPERVGSVHIDFEEGEAYYFSNDIELAKWYAKDSARILGAKPAKGHVFEVYLSMQNPLIVDFRGEGFERIGEEIGNAKNNGHDGLVCKNYDDAGVSDHYLAFSPTQIKCARSNSGLYSNDDPRLGDGAHQELRVEVKKALKARSAVKKEAKQALQASC